MKNLLTSFKRNLALAVLVLILFLLIWLKLFIVPRVPTDTISPAPSVSIPVPQALVSPAPFTESPSIINRENIVFKFKGTPPAYPQTLALYDGSKQLTTNLDSAKSIVEKFAFEGEPAAAEKNYQQANYYIWQQSDGMRTISVGAYPPIVHFNNFSVLDNQAVEKIDKQFFLERSREELKKLPLAIAGVDFSAAGFSFSRYLPKGNEVDEGEIIPTQNENEANLITISLAYKLGDYSSIVNSETFSPISLIFNTAGDLYGLTVLLFSPHTSDSSLTTVPFDKIVASLSAKAVILSAVSTQNTQELDLPVFNLSQVDLTKAQVIYYLSADKEQRIKPYLLFSGSARDSNTNEEIMITAISPLD